MPRPHRRDFAPSLTVYEPSREECKRAHRIAANLPELTHDEFEVFLHLQWHDERLRETLRNECIMRGKFHVFECDEFADILPLRCYRAMPRE